MSGIDTKKEAVKNQDNRRRLTFVVVRHGERLDYAHRAVGKNWCKANPEQPWNPPLTEKGLSMATQLGSALRNDILPDLGLPPVSAVYTSPFLRCRQTAAAIVQGILSEETDQEGCDSDPHSTLSPPLKVKVELGLSESINENWYRSWSLPGTDGTWGYKKKEIPHIDPVRDQMDHRALKPVEALLDWKQSRDVTSFKKTLHSIMDHEHRSLTTLGGNYTFAGNPPQVENGQGQRSRISRTIDVLSEEHLSHFATSKESIDEDKAKERDETIVLVSHGGIVMQFYKNLTGNNSKMHGVGKYCCFSIYRNDTEASSKEVEEEDDAGNKKWTPLVVNRILWNEGAPSNQSSRDNDI